MAIQRVWPKRQNISYVCMVFDDKTGEIGMEVRGDVANIEACMNKCQAEFKKHLTPVDGIVQ